MAVIGGVSYSSDLFTVDKRMFIAEASTLAHGGDEFTGQIYDDAADAGLTIISKRTGQKATFYIDLEQRDREGELQVTILKPIAETLRKFPWLRGWTVHVLND